MVACPDNSSGGGVTTYDFICRNGTAADGGATVENITSCKSCNTGFKLTPAKTCVMRPYVCEHGIPSGDDATADNITKCQRCANGYVLTAAETCNHAYVCNNGTASTDTNATAANITKCQSCTTGYVLTAAETCNHAYVCANGTPTENTDATADNVTQCASCSSGYKIVNSTCVATQYTCTNGTLDPAATGKPSGTQDEERCSVCNCGFTLNSGACNTTVLTLGDTNAVSCTVTQDTTFNFTVGAREATVTPKPSGGLLPVYQYTLGSNVQIKSITPQGGTALSADRYSTACSNDFDVTVDLDLTDSSTNASICDRGFTLFAPTATGSHSMVVGPTSGTGSATTSLQIKTTGLTQLPYGGTTEVGTNFKSHWYYVAMNSGDNLVVEVPNSGIAATGNAIWIGLFRSTFISQIGGNIIFSNGQATPASFQFSSNNTNSNAIRLVRIRAISNVLSNHGFELRFCPNVNTGSNVSC